MAASRRSLRWSCTRSSRTGRGSSRRLAAGCCCCLSWAEPCAWSACESCARVPSGQWQIGPTGMQPSLSERQPDRRRSHRQACAFRGLACCLSSPLPMALLFALVPQRRRRTSRGRERGGGGWVAAILRWPSLGFVGTVRREVVCGQRRHQVAQQEAAVAPAIAEMQSDGECAQAGADAACSHAAERWTSTTLMDKVDEPRIPLPPSRRRQAGAAERRGREPRIARSEDAEKSTPNWRAEAKAAVAAIAEERGIEQARPLQSHREDRRSPRTQRAATIAKQVRRRPR